jgi:serine/threonine protein kinase/CRP-like cAMP-binding protein
MDSSNSQSQQQQQSAPSPPVIREEHTSPATKVPPLVRTDVGATVSPNSTNAASAATAAGTDYTNAATTTTTASGVAARRVAAPIVLPPLPAPAATRLPAVSSTTVAVTPVSAYGASATPVSVPTSALHPVPAMAPLHVNSTASLATASLSGGDASGLDDVTAPTGSEQEPILTNGSIALAEFTSLLRPSENTNVLREHIIHLLRDVDTEDTLVRIARTLEAQEDGRSAAEVSSTTWNETSKMTPTTTNGSNSTRASTSFSARQSRRSSAMSRQDATSFEALAGFSFLHSHRRTTSVQDSPSSQQPSEDATVHNRSTRGFGGPMEVSFSSQSSHPTLGPDSRRTSKRKSRDDAASSVTATQVSQLSESTAALHVDPLKREVPIPPTAVRSEGRRVAVSAAPCAAPPDILNDGDEGGADGAGAPELMRPPPPLRVIPKTTAEEQQLRRLLRRCHSFANLEPDVLDDVVKAMEKEVHAAGTAILEQGQDSSEKMYLVGEGTCEAIKNGKSMGPLQPGGTFGELELMYKQAKCAATIRCVTRCVLYSLDEMSYHRAVMTNSMQKRKRFEKLTLNVPFLRCMPDFERMKIAEALVTREYRRGQAIIKFGSSGTHMHFIVEGEVKVVGRNNGRKVEVVRLQAGDVVGELEFLFNHLTVADVIATSHRVVTACISRDHFELIIGPIQDRLKEFVATSATYENYYLSEVAGESVRSELSRIASTRKHRRVASKDTAMTLEDVNAHGEVLLSAPLVLMNGKGGKTRPDGSSPYSPSARNDNSSGGGGGNTLMSPGEMLGEGTRDSKRLPRALLRFPFAPITGKDVAVLAMREDGLIIYWNAVLERLTSYPAEEVVGQNIYSFLLAEKEQKTMLKAITTAKSFAGDVDGFLERPNTKANHFTLSRSDGLTKATLELTVVPPVVSAGGDAAEVVLGFGEEVKQGPQIILEQPQWLSEQIRCILADGTQTFEERLECIAETLNNFESTYRAMTVSTENLRVVNIRQMVGHVLMDFGSEFVTRGVSVRQRFEGLVYERAYLNADLLPECLRYAMKLCLKFSQAGGGVVTITITVTSKNGLDFLIINFNLAGDGLPEDIAKFFDPGFDQRRNSVEDDSTADEEDDDESNIGSDSATSKRGLPPRLRRKLRRVQHAVEEQGGTLRIQRNPEDANIVFLIPYMAATDEEPEDASVEETLHTGMESSSQFTSLTNLPTASLGGLPTRGTTVPNGASLLPADHSEDIGSVSAPPTPGDESGLLNGSSGLNQPSFSFTTCLAEDNPAHRIMLSSFLWERRHAVLTAFKFEDVVKLLGVADILIIDLQQSVICSLRDDDPINRLREMLRHMAVIITSISFDLVSSDTYEAAGFITLKKPCTPVQALKAIRRAEEKSAVVKLERLRIEQTRETLARNSRGAWRRGALLGKGSFGEVYEAFDVLTGGKMAVKEMRLGGNDARIEQFVQEISTMCNLQHPNIIHYFYCEESKEQKVIRVFMEFAGGGTLQSLLKKKGKLEFTELRALLRDVVEGLAYIHSQHYVHCDIKTANVLLSADGKGKIGDFGTAHTVHEGELLYVMQGSPLYMSPECMSAGEEDEDGNRIGYSFPSDIWSLGCVAMEMATTKPPFSHIKNMKGPAGLTNYITSLTDVPDLSPLFRCEPSIVEFVSACLNPDPTQRATAQELLQMSLFSESTHSDRNSAVKALKRAQLLHVLNKFVAFQEPEEADELERRRNRFRVRQHSSDFFSSSSSSSSKDSERVSLSSSSSSTTVASFNLTGLSKGEKSARLGTSKSVVAGNGNAVVLDAAAAGAEAASKNRDDPDSELPRRSETVAQVGDGGAATNSNTPNNATTPAPAAVVASTSTSTLEKGNDSAADSRRRRESGEGKARGVKIFRTLRKWHSSSSSSSTPSSSLSDNPTVHEAGEGPHTSSAGVAQLLTTQAATSLQSTESVPPAQATVAGTEGLLTPPRHLDPHVGTEADQSEEPEPRRPISDDAYDLSPTPKKRSKTQSRPPRLQESQQQQPPNAPSKKTKKEEKAAVARKLKQWRSSSSGRSDSTDSNEAAFFATSSDSSDDNGSRHESAKLEKDESGNAAGCTVVSHAVAVTTGDVGATAAAVVSGSAAATKAAKNNNNSSNPLSATSPHASPLVENGTPSSRQLSSLAAERSSASTAATSGTNINNHLPTFGGRRRNVIVDDDGNIVLFQRFTSAGSASVSRDSREPPVTARSNDQAISKLGSAAAVASPGEECVALPRGDTTLLGDTAGHLSSSAIGNASGGGGGGSFPLRSSGGVTISSSPAGVPPMVTNVSFGTHPQNMSFFNYSFNKNISFMGATIDETLSSAANDFLNSLATAGTNGGHGHTNVVPGSSSVFNVDTQTAPSHAAERRGSAPGSHHDGDTNEDSNGVFNSPLAPDTPTTTGSTRADTAAAAAGTGAGRQTSDSQASSSRHSPCASMPATQPQRSVDSTVAGTAEGNSRGHRDSSLTGTHTDFQHNSSLSQVPPLHSAMRHNSRSHTSTNETETSSSVSPRGTSVPLVGANASVARRPPRVRPPITNQSFFVVEDLGGLPLSNSSMALSFAAPFAYGGDRFANTFSQLNSTAAASVAPVSATTLSNGAAGGGNGGSAGGESATSLLRHNPGVAVVAPPPPFSAFASTTAARDAWRHRRRFGGHAGSSYPALPNSNENSRYAPSQGGRGGGASSVVNGVPVAGGAAEDSFYNEPALSSTAFDSVRSASSRRSSVRGGDGVPYLTAERLQQVAAQAPHNAADGFSPFPQEQFSSDGRHSAVFSTLTTHDESPLFTYLKRINQSLIDVAAQLQARRRGNSDAVSSTMLDSAVTLSDNSLHLINAQPPPTPQQQSGALSPLQRPHPHASTHQPPTSLIARPLLPPAASATSAAAAAAASAAGTPSAGESGSGASTSGSGAPPVSLGAASRPRNSSGVNRTSLPRPVSSCPGSRSASTPKATRGTLSPLGSQMVAGRNNPLWPADDVGESVFFSPVRVSHGQPSTLDSTTNSAHGATNASRGVSSEGESGNNSGGVEALLHKMLQRVNTLIDQVSHLPPHAPSHSAETVSTPAPVAVPHGVEGAA